MAAESKWIRLNVDWHESKWLAKMPWATRAVITVVLTYIKVHGSDGRCKAPILSRWASGHDIPLENVEAFIQGAVEAGALLVDDDYWEIPAWDTYQKSDVTAAERQAAWRERQKAKREPEAVTVTEPNAVTATSHDVTKKPNAVTPQSHTVTPESNGTITPLSVTKTEDNGVTLSRDIDRDKDIDSNSGPIGPVATATKPKNPNEPFQRAQRVMATIAEQLGWKPPLDVDVRKQLRPEDPIQVLINEFGEEATCVMFLWAHQNWSQKPTWKALAGQRNQLYETIQERTRDAERHPAVRQVLTSVNQALGWPPPTDFDVGYHTDEGHILTLLGSVSPEEAAEMYLSARHAWEGRVSWKSVVLKRHELRKPPEITSESAPSAPDPVEGVDFERRMVKRTLRATGTEVELEAMFVPGTETRFELSEWRLAQSRQIREQAS